MRVFGNWQSQAVLVTGISVVATGSFHTIPAEIVARQVICRHKVDLFDRVLPDVPDIEIPGQLVETEAPGIAEPIRKDLWLRVLAANERIGAGHGIGRSFRRARRIDIDSEDLAKPRIEILPIPVRITLDPPSPSPM